MVERAVTTGSSGWIEIDRSALLHNVETFRQVLNQQSRLGAVVKADAYGHGLRAVVSCLFGQVDVLYVIAAADAHRVRAYEAEAGASPTRIVVIGALGAEEVVELARIGAEVVIGDAGWVSWVAPLRAAGRRVGVHVHVDSGLGREGFLPERVADELHAWPEASDTLVPRGVMTHFADTEDVTEQAYGHLQLARFHQGAEAVERLVGGVVLERHAAASAPTLVLPGARLDVVRVGIAMYGLWPSRETRISTRIVRGELPRLEPVLRWRVVAQHVKELPAGSYVGYGCTHRCPHDTRVAVLPVGYFDGYPRALSHRAHVLVAGRRCAVLGRVMMNHIVVDVTDVPAAHEPWVATLIGRDGAEEITADDLAGWAGTINYEIVARLGAHIPRRCVAGEGSAG